MNNQDHTGWKVVKSEWTVPCDHELCHQFHRRFGEPCGTWFNTMTGRWQNWHHEAKRFTWIIVDADGNRLHQFDDFYYETKREATQRLARYIAEVEEQVK